MGPIVPDSNPLARIRGWLPVFTLVHALLAFYYFASSVYAAAGFWKTGGVWWMGAVNIAFGLMLPATLLLLLWRKPAFRWVYVAYSVLMIANCAVTCLQTQGMITLMNIIIALLMTLPWCLYLFLSRRVKAVLEQPAAETPTQPQTKRSIPLTERTGQLPGKM